MGGPSGLEPRWEQGALTVEVRPYGPVPAASVAAVATGGSALAFLVAVLLHVAGLEALALSALVGVPGVPIAVMVGLPTALRRWRERVVELVVASPELILGRRRVSLDDVERAAPVLSERGYALRIDTRRGPVHVPLGGHDLATVRWLVAAVERQRHAHGLLSDAHHDALRRLGALRGPPRPRGDPGDTAP